MVGRLILILGDQLSLDIAALKSANPAHDVVVMAEVRAEGTYAPHHPQKIALVLTAMRKFAAELGAKGWQVAYTRLDDADNSHSISGELLRRAAEFSRTHVTATRPGEWRLIAALQDVPLDVTILEDDRFIASHADFDTWADGRKQLRMEWFYRDMRRKTGLLMDGDQPTGGQWNFDHDNRKRAAQDMLRPQALRFELDQVTDEVLALVETEFPDHFGRLRPFHWATDRAGALQALHHFITHSLPRFGDEQDAMLMDAPFISHSLLSPYLNIGLLSPLEVCQAAATAHQKGKAPLNAVEGFIRQIIGWREFVRGIYFHQGPDYTSRNALGHSRALPPLYWGGKTRMTCLSQSVAQTRDHAYAHHIQRLMVTGTFGLLAGIDPAHLHEWYLAVYIDAFEWVEAPNTLGMSQFADGGLLASKPYAASGAYINRMSDYCGSCAYKVAEKTGPDACPFNSLFWDFVQRHRDVLAKNPRMGQMVRTWDKMTPAHQAQVLETSTDILARLDAGKVV
ncbi:deoxyribodipyrimidine photolyase-related protein [Pseudorhodobacter antarcticus]|uniref:Deoxyribodipyrimidine photolyase-related protein n=1 Tax=Pseudorhodobacter antarcticus TaxID=1077947 RepID=A0A1H8B934_9RHOB|nr:cryptochrome/photolyase family protein [Pseudorhodobacter antarcticus]SEM78367.1 deoxyribodipyrimidine photolyase-related protein [Pseudorhodobacter antarcticus]